MGGEQEARPDQQPAPARAPAQDRSPGATSPAALAQDSDAAWAAVEEFAKTGKGTAAGMPLLLKAIPRTKRDDAHMLMPVLAARMDGELFLDCAAALGYVPYFAVSVALDTAKPPANAAAIRSYLRGRSIAELVKLETSPPVIKQLQALLPGPLGLEVPQLAELPEELHDKRSLLHWFVESAASPTVLAVTLGQAGSQKLAATLDLDPVLWNFLDHLQIGGGVQLGDSLGRLAKGTKDAAAKAKLDKILKTLPQFDEADPSRDDAVFAARTKRQEDARAELNANIAGDMDTFTLLDAAARAGTIEGRPEKEMAAKIRGQPAGVVLQFAIASTMKADEAMSLLLEAADVLPDHVMTLVYSYSLTRSRLSILKHDRLRKRVRNVVGRATPFLDFFPDGAQQETAHPMMIGDEALRQWVYESTDERHWLWLAVGSAEAAKQGCGFVQREQGFKWVKQLPVDSDNERLRRFVLNVKDSKAKQHVEQNLLADRPIIYDEGDWDAQPIDPVILGAGDKARFDVATKVGDGDEDEILDRIADLEPSERADAVKTPSSLEAAVKKLSGDALARAVFALGPTIAQLLGAGKVYEPRLLSYLRTRAASEEHEVVGNARLAKLARGLFGTSPFVVFPSLLDANVMAKALDKNPDLLEWVFVEAAASQALAVISREPARGQAAAIVEGNFELYAHLPKYKFLLPEGKAGFDALATSLEDDQPIEDAGKYKAGKQKLDGGAKQQGEQLHDAAAADHLWTAIDQLGKGASDANAYAVVHAFPKDQVQLLSGGHTSAVDALRAIVPVPPQHVFPSLGIAQLLSCRDGARWLFELESSFMILALVASSKAAIKQLARLIEKPTQAVTDWLALLPRGGRLDAAERQTLDELCRHVAVPEAVRGLFEIRYDVTIEADFDVATTKRLWGVLARLPPAQVNQRAIEQFRRDPTPGAAGLWDDPNVVLSDDEGDFKKGTVDTSYDAAPDLTADEIKRYYGLDDAAFAKATDPTMGWISIQGTKYRVKPIEEDKFKSTVLHEVGHSIDTMLGERTELVFGLAGWKNYGIDQVEDWANDMQALDGVKGADRKKIIEAWQHALRTGSSVGSLVGADHPAMASHYKHVPLVAAALEGSKFDHTERREVNGRVGVTGNNQGTIATVPKATVDVAPSVYSLSAAPEFFAECYTEFYREFDGTQKTAHLKGGKLAVWIKDWFAANVDRIELGPHRAKQPAAEPSPDRAADRVTKRG